MAVRGQVLDNGGIRLTYDDACRFCGTATGRVGAHTVCRGCRGAAARQARDFRRRFASVDRSGPVVMLEQIIVDDPHVGYPPATFHASPPRIDWISSDMTDGVHVDPAEVREFLETAGPFMGREG